MRRPGRTIAGVLASIALVGACSTEVGGLPRPAAPDVSKLEVGNFPTVPRAIGNAKSEKQGRIREGQRLADYVALPFEIDSRFADPDPVQRVANPAPGDDSLNLRFDNTPHVITDSHALGKLVINDTFDEVAKNLVVGYVTSGTTDQDAERSAHIVNAVMMFPDDAEAKRVAETLERDDFTYNPENQPVTVTGHPDAHAHWRPSYPGVGSWLAHGRYVIMTNVSDTTMNPPQLPPLVDLVSKTLDTQVPLIDEFEPTPADQLDDLPLDPDGILGRTLPAFDITTRADADGVLGARGTLNQMSDPVESKQQFDQAGVDAVAFSGSAVFRARDAAATRGLFAEWTKDEPDPDQVTHPLDPPAGTNGDVACRSVPIRDGKPVVGRPAFCVVKFNRYIAQVLALNEQEVLQRAAAQYALLGSTAQPAPPAQAKSAGDVAKLDTGPFPKEPSDFARFTEDYQEQSKLKITEADRLLDLLVQQSDIDPDLREVGEVHFFKEANDVRDVLPDYLTAPIETNRFVAGVSSVRTNGIRDVKRIINMLLRFPTDDLARAAAADLDRTFRERDSAQRSVPLPDYPDAHANGKDGGRALTVFTAHGPYVSVTNFGFPDDNQSAHVDVAQKLLDAQLQRLDSEGATPLDDILDTPSDKDGIMRRTIPESKDRFYLRDNWGYFTPNGALHFERDPVASKAAFDEAGVDLVGRRGAVVYRAKDDKAAAKLKDVLGAPSTEWDPIDAPPGLGEAKCLEKRSGATGDDKYVCVIAEGRYVAAVPVESTQTTVTLYQKTAAQFSILTKSE